jgi:two-component system, NarL family, sensor histidine kinase UhpB
MNELKILYLEDSAQDAELTARILKKAGIPFRFQLVDNQNEYETALRQSRPDLVLSDHSLFHFNSVEALKIFKSYEYNVPFILVTGTVSEEFAVNILKEGANDYLLKNNLTRLPNAILNALEKYRMEQERQQHVNKIIAKEALLRETQHMAKIGSWEVDLTTGVTKWSDELYRIYGYEPGEVLSDIATIKNHIHPEDIAEFEKSITVAMNSVQHSYESEFRIIDKTKKVKHINFKMAIERDGDALPVRLVGFSHDITDKKEAQLKMLESVKEITTLEKELADHKLQQQKIITEAAIQAQEKERNELGKELHDNINQILSTVKMYLGLHMQGAETEIDLIQASHAHLSDAIEEIRKLSKTLITPTLGPIGLKEAIEDLKQNVELFSDVTMQLQYNVVLHTLDDNRKLMLYRIIQEQLNNILKHAKASNVLISLKEKSDMVKLCIADDGVGFDPSEKTKGIGLKNILSRVQFYSGYFKLTSSPGNGCVISISIPANSSHY